MLRGRMEHDMTESNTVQDAKQCALSEEEGSNADPATKFTPSQFFKEVGILVSVCIGLALLAQVLVPMIGEH
jgi:hypothetical protein